MAAKDRIQWLKMATVERDEMQLLTEEIRAKLPPIASSGDIKPEDIKIIVKFFDPCGSWTWYATEYDPKDRQFYGLVRGLETELGYFSLDVLESIKGPLGLGIERDMYFGFNHTLAEAQASQI